METQIMSPEGDLSLLRQCPKLSLIQFSTVADDGVEEDWRQRIGTTVYISSFIGEKMEELITVWREEVFLDPELGIIVDVWPSEPYQTVIWWYNDKPVPADVVNKIKLEHGAVGEGGTRGRDLRLQQEIWDRLFEWAEKEE
jgi:hypothetical protein